MKLAKVFALSAAAVLATGISGLAAEPQGWKVEVTPYAWLMGIDGDVEIKDHKLDFDQSFNDLIDHVDFAGSLISVVQKDRMVLFGQFDYFSLNEDGDVPKTALEGEIDVDTTFAVLAAGWQFDGFVENSTIDLLAGARYAGFDAEIDIDTRGKADRSVDIVDPVLVLRPSFPLFPSKVTGLRFNPTLSVGGGGDSDLVYEMQPELQYNFTETIAGRLGYRRVHYKYDEGDRKADWDVDFSGFLIGLGVTL